MATEVIHEHTGSDNSTGIIVAILMIVVLAFLAFYFLGNGLLQGMSSGGTNVQVPDKIDVNVQGGSSGN